MSLNLRPGPRREPWRMLAPAPPSGRGPPGQLRLHRGSARLLRGQRPRGTMMPYAGGLRRLWAEQRPKCRVERQRVPPGVGPAPSPEALLGRCHLSGRMRGQLLLCLERPRLLLAELKQPLLPSADGLALSRQRGESYESEECESLQFEGIGSEAYHPL